MSRQRLPIVVGFAEGKPMSVAEKVKGIVGDLGDSQIRNSIAHIALPRGSHAHIESMHAQLTRICNSIGQCRRLHGARVGPAAAG